MRSDAKEGVSYKMKTFPPNCKTPDYLNIKEIHYVMVGYEESNKECIVLAFPTDHNIDMKEITDKYNGEKHVEIKVTKK